MLYTNLYFFPIDNPIEVRLDHGLRSSHLRCDSDACGRSVCMVRRYCGHINIVCGKGRQLVDCVRSSLRVQQYRPTRHNLSLCDPLWVHKLFYCIIWYLYSKPRLSLDCLYKLTNILYNLTKIFYYSYKYLDTSLNQQIKFVG